MADRINTDFSDFNEDPFYKACMLVCKCLKKNEDRFTDLPVKMNVLLPIVKEFNEVRTAPSYTSKAAEVKDFRTKIQKIITRNGNWLNSFCEGDLTLLHLTGYPLQQPGEAQGPLEETILSMDWADNGRNLSYIISKIDKQGIRYGIMYTLADNPDENPENWKFHYCAGRKGIIKGLKSLVDYKFVSFGMGTEQQLTYSQPVILSVQ